MMSKTPAISIRNATTSDAEAVCELGRHVFTLTFGHTVTQKQLTDYLDQDYSTGAIRELINDPSKTMLVAADASGRLAGFTVLVRGSEEPVVEQYESRVEMLRLYVHPDYQGLGVGKRLSYAVEQLAKDEGFEHLWLGVWEFNERAQALYRKQGFRKIGQHIFDVGGDLQTDEIMIKKLQ